MAAVKETGKWKYIDKTGKVVFEASDADYAYNFSDGMARFQKGLRLGYFDKTGKVVVQAIYDYAFDFFEFRFRRTGSHSNWPDCIAPFWREKNP
jgi:hypothetical protein